MPTSPPISAPPGAAKSAGPRAFAIPGETLEFVVKLRGITLGRVRTAIGDQGVHDGRRAIIMRSRGDADGVLAIFGKLAYELTTTIDLERGGPLLLREESWLEIAGHEEHDRDDQAFDGEWDLPYDAHAAIARMRAWETKLGEQIQIKLRVAGADVTLELEHTGHQYLPSARAHAVRYHGVADTDGDDFPFTIWISDDPSRVPLELVTGSEWGTITAELAAYDQLPSL